MHTTDSTSSTIAKIQYDDEKQEMVVHFKSGSAYSYPGVTPEDHAEFIAAPSHGKHFGANIRNKYSGTKL